MSNYFKKLPALYLALFLFAAFFFPAVPSALAQTPTESGREICDNGIDDDNDTLLDGADTDCYTLLAPLPGLTTVNTTTGLPSYLNTIFRLLIGIAGVFAVVRIVLFGIQYMMSESAGDRSSISSKIWTTLGGIILLAGSVILLNTINPRLTDVGLKLETVSHELEPKEGEGAGTGNQNFSNLPSTPCAAGTIAIPNQVDGYAGGQKYSVQLCALPNLVSASSESTPGTSYYIEGANGKALVHSSVSKSWHDLVSAAVQNGVYLSASSSFRTWEHQNDLCGGTCDGSLVAKPGYSPHQMGFAIDFAGTSVKGTSSTSCTGRATDPNSPTWAWLAANAKNFGIKQYSNESWHWDTLDMANRCE